MSREKLNDIKKVNKRLLAKCINFKDPACIFIFFVLLSVLVFLSICLIMGDGYFSKIFFRLCGDLFMDHFNSIRDASQGAAVYTERGVIYPPMANLIYLTLSRISPSGYNNTSFEYRQTWIYYPTAILLVCLVIIVISILIYSLFKEKLKRNKVISALFGAAAIFNAATLYTLERGNIVLLSLISLAFFAFSYNSESRVARELGIVALAFSVSIKVYPAMFFLLFIAEKRYRELFRGIIYTVLMFVIPSFFFGGPVCLWWLVENIFSFSSDKSFTIGAVTILADLLNLPYALISNLAYIWCFICLGSFVASVFLKEEPFKVWTKGIALTIVAPPLTALYSWSFLLIPITLLANSYKEIPKKYILPFAIILVPFVILTFRINYFLDANSLLVYIFGALLSITLVVDTVIVLVRKIKISRATRA